MFKIITGMLMVLIICAMTSCCGRCGLCGVAEQSNVSAQEEVIKHLDLNEFTKVVDNKSAVILDARSGKWDDGRRVPGAKSLSSSSSEAEINKMLPDKKQAVVTYCSNTKCPASKMLATKLIGMGYTNVSEYAPGIKGWVEAGKPIEMAK